MSPFDPVLLNHNEAQLDFILTMFARDNPKLLRVERPGMVDSRVADTQSDVAWSNVLMGDAYQKFMSKHLPPEAVLRRLRGEPSPEPANMQGVPRFFMVPD